MTSGSIRISRELDYEDNQQYELVILARDVANEKSASATLTVNVVDVNDNPPSCDIRAFSVEVPEDFITPGQVKERRNVISINDYIFIPKSFCHRFSDGIIHAKCIFINTTAVDAAVMYSRS